MKSIIKVDNLSMSFGGLKAVDSLSFTVETGSIFGLIGPNGAGKTTVFNCISRFYKPDNGSLPLRQMISPIILWITKSMK